MEYKEYELRDDEISLKELIKGLISEWKIVVGVAASIFLIAIIYAFGFTQHVYESNLDFIIKVPKLVVTRYGEYTLPSENLSDYANTLTSNEVIDDMYLLYGGDKTKYNLSKDAIKGMITVENEDNSSRFIVKIQHTDPELAKNMLNDLYKSFETNLRINSKLAAVSEFKYNYSIQIDVQTVDIETKKNILESDKKLLDEMEQKVILQKALLSDQEAAALYAEENNVSLESLTGNSMMEEIESENYVVLKKKVVEEESELNKLEEELKKTTILYNEILAEESLINELDGTTEKSEILNGKLDVFSGFVNVTSEPVVPESPVGGGKAMPLAIGILLGGMLGIFVGIFKNYWKS